MVRAATISFSEVVLAPGEQIQDIRFTSSNLSRLKIIDLDTGKPSDQMVVLYEGEQAELKAEGMGDVSVEITIYIDTSAITGVPTVRSITTTLNLRVRGNIA